MIDDGLEVLSLEVAEVAGIVVSLIFLECITFFYFPYKAEKSESGRLKQPGREK